MDTAILLLIIGAVILAACGIFFLHCRRLANRVEPEYEFDEDDEEDMEEEIMPLPVPGQPQSQEAAPKDQRHDYRYNRGASAFMTAILNGDLEEVDDPDGSIMAAPTGMQLAKNVASKGKFQHQGAYEMDAPARARIQAQQARRGQARGDRSPRVRVISVSPQAPQPGGIEISVGGRRSSVSHGMIEDAMLSVTGSPRSPSMASRGSCSPHSSPSLSPHGSQRLLGGTVSRLEENPDSQVEMEDVFGLPYALLEEEFQVFREVRAQVRNRPGRLRAVKQSGQANLTAGARSAFSVKHSRLTINTENTRGSTNGRSRESHAQARERRMQARGGASNWEDFPSPLHHRGRGLSPAALLAAQMDSPPSPVNSRGRSLSPSHLSPSYTSGSSSPASPVSPNRLRRLSSSGQLGREQPSRNAAPAMALPPPAQSPEQAISLSEVKKLLKRVCPHTKWSEQLQRDDMGANNCIVCLDDFEVGTPVCVLSCLHRYHPDCISRVLQVQKKVENMTCPICRCGVFSGQR